MVILLTAGCDWPVDVKQQMGNRCRPPPKGADYIRELLLLQLDFDVDASRQIQLHQCINRLVCRINDIHQTQMRTNFKLIAGSLVDVRRTQDIETLLAGWQRNGTANDSTGTLGGFDDFLSGLIDQAIIEGLETDTDFFGFAFWLPKNNGANICSPRFSKRTITR